ncbi:MAG: hypothetical protein ACXWNK_05255 [Vulcanimicrobiaceae bacterium]
MQRLREGGASGVPFLYLYMYEQIIEMALISMADVRRKLDYESQGSVAIGSVLLRAGEVRVSEAQPDFYPANDSGRSLVTRSDEVWIPDEPLVLDGADLDQRAKEIASEMTADLRVRLE